MSLTIEFPTLLDIADGIGQRRVVGGEWEISFFLRAVGMTDVHVQMAVGGIEPHDSLPLSLDPGHVLDDKFDNPFAFPDERDLYLVVR
jgi:hypothetical protein